jgi:hypothetical protein
MMTIETPDGKGAEPGEMGFQFDITGGEKTRGRQRFYGLRELLFVKLFEGGMITTPAFPIKDKQFFLSEHLLDVGLNKSIVH